MSVIRTVAISLLMFILGYAFALGIPRVSYVYYESALGQAQSACSLKSRLERSFEDDLVYDDKQALYKQVALLAVRCQEIEIIATKVSLFSHYGAEDIREIYTGLLERKGNQK